jgi:hypothetical protein
MQQLRCIYFDRIERSDVETVISSIFKSVSSLEDMQFLVKYAAQVFPPSPDEARGDLIWSNIIALQQDLRDKRQVTSYHFPLQLTLIFAKQLDPYFLIPCFHRLLSII